MYKSALLRLLFNIEPKKDLSIHYYNIGKLYSILPKVKDSLYIEFINYNTNSTSSSCNSNNYSNLELYNNKIDKKPCNQNIYEIFKSNIVDIFTKDLSASEVELKKILTSDPNNKKVTEYYDSLKYFEKMLFIYYQIAFNYNPKLDCSIIPVNFLRSSTTNEPTHSSSITTPNFPIDTVFIENLDSDHIDLDDINKDRQSRNLGSIDSVHLLDTEFQYPLELYPKSYYNRSHTSSLDVFENISNQWTPLFKGDVLGGTFDRMHPGHKVMLTMGSVLTSQYMECGVTDNSILTKKKFSQLIEPLTYRSTKTKNFLQSINPSVNYNMLQLFEPYANTMTSERLECIIISPETLPTANHINKVRTETKLKPLEVYSVSYFESPLQNKEDFKVSSSYLRELDHLKMVAASNSTTTTDLTPNL
ncbi:putative pantetheine-phosphate adenylyltransferase [Tieghemostelium lacteum]|uniref:Putative pantetheine-phosphate adenylyltransferase n=1 Tax=Tieghemostelium lacteum TaxID=361077 RepID=A0A151ZKK7_TIELA|nr:putative pantetheine-phosphate adenylyltransferase [Tieghemostelium lacteum]|eukprot:KYQ94439.1 putative pantetheine-phosphate adenylyltransferase [Tieghemostelium lacteum]